MAKVLGIEDSEVDIGNVVETENGVNVEGIHSADVETPDDFSQKVANELRKNKTFENAHAKGNKIYNCTPASMSFSIRNENKKLSICFSFTIQTPTLDHK